MYNCTCVCVCVGGFAHGCAWMCVYTCVCSCVHECAWVCACVCTCALGEAQGGNSLRYHLSGCSVIRADASQIRVNCNLEGQKLIPPPPALLTVNNQGFTSDLQEADSGWVQEGPRCRHKDEFSSLDFVSFLGENAHWPKSKESN